ncbi:hypothetical protein [Octadecabacter ascidiaceicola]|uniref:Uncharacterized protein n=1 Tax=Octadecabacter ascidiaceicola TaxID=1655543 RepID=A0A238KCS3_9RHOB|nr:hypothetical protein [Octadecabacter ascidiaceicola]SMX40002.1 hypothetical protein OCA8868_02223 [Octadecabacter ascidiaceicola]
MFVRLCAFVLLLVGLSGCEDIEGMANNVAGQLANVGAATDATSEGIRTLSLLGGDVRVRGPEAYCVDQGASNARRGFAVLAGCALLSDDAGFMPTLDGLITVQFGDEDTANVTGNETTFAQFLESESGRALLAGSGDAASVSDVSTVTGDTGVMARFEDTSGGPVFTGTSGPQWRGFLDINGRLTTISVLSFDRSALSRGEGERLLTVAMAELGEANAPVVVAEAETE